MWKEEEDAFKLQSTQIKSKIVFFARWQTEMQHVKCNVSDQSVSLSHSFRVKAINCTTSVLKVFNRLPWIWFLVCRKSPALHFTASSKAPSRHRLIIWDWKEIGSYSLHILYQHLKQTQPITPALVAPVLHLVISKRGYKSKAIQIWILTLHLPSTSNQGLFPHVE